MFNRIMKHIVVVAISGTVLTGSALARAEPDEVVQRWYKLMLELVRHTPTYSPPVASRTFAYVGVTTYESLASGDGAYQSLAGQLNGLKPIPVRESTTYDEGIVAHTALSLTVEHYFSNTGPTGKRALHALQRKLGEKSRQGVADDVAQRSESYGKSIASHILAWSLEDGADVIANMGFPMAYEEPKGKSSWVPTSMILQQQTPLLPDWGKQRTFAMPDGATCKLPPPPEYSEAPDSAFFKEALEVVESRKTITPVQRDIARFWSDDPMLSPTPPGHWISIALQMIQRDKIDAKKSADLLARLGVTLADAFIGCWHTKFEYDLVRPITYIRRTMDKKWESLLITPPFPEYPSGHSTQSGAAADVLTAVFGDNVAFVDDTHKRDGLPARSFANFRAAAEEAGISRLYGGIHFRAAIERGLEQGRCIGAFAVRLRTHR